MTIRIEILRHPSAPQGTKGVITLPQFNWQRACIELPWADNEPQHSCVIAGTYDGRLRPSTKWSPRPDGQLYEVMGVPGRTAILLHAATYAGDVRAGWKADLLGCVAPGSRFVTLPAPEGFQRQQEGVVDSRKTLTELMLLCGDSDVQFVIGWEPGAEPKVMTA